MLERLPIDETAEGPRRFRNPTSEQRPDFIEQPARELLVDAARHALGRRRGRQPQRDRHHLHIRER